MLKSIIFPTCLAFAVLLLLSGCQVGRFFVYNFANITDHKIFPASEIETGPETYRFTKTDNNYLTAYTVSTRKKGDLSLTDYLREETTTTAFLVIRNDSILYENYFQGYAPDDISTFFSVSKSITSLLVGIAVDEGLIENIDDPVTKYIPELRTADPGFQQQTIRHLLNMRSGLDYKESYSNPFADMAQLYYGRNQLGQIAKMKFRETPGTVHRYQSVSTAILGIIVEKVSGMDLGQFTEAKVWQPMGMEFPASWSLDDKKHGSAKGYSGLNAAARDLAKIGRLYLNGGLWDGKRIVSEDWVRSSVVPDMDNDAYQFQWYGVDDTARDSTGQYMTFPDSLSAVAATEKFKVPHKEVYERPSAPGEWRVHIATAEFYAMGILNQLMIIDPKTKTIVIRLGKKWDDGYLGLMRRVRGYVNTDSK
jgi:CubicO group peptidase (beta-lactamase class C family)